MNSKKTKTKTQTKVKDLKAKKNPKGGGGGISAPGIKDRKVGGGVAIEPIYN